MQFTVQHKLAFALVCLVLLLNLLLFTLVNASFQKGFLDYINTIQIQRLTPLATALGSSFNNSEELAELRHNPRYWHQLLRDNISNDSPNPMESLGLHDDRPPPSHKPHRERPLKEHHPRDDHRFNQGDKPPRHGPPPRHHRPPPKGPKVALLNDRKDFIFGRKEELATLNLVPINNAAGETIGHLGLPALKLPQSDTDLGFAQQQTRIFAFAAIAISLLSAVLAWPLASLLVRPLRKISESVSELTAGNFKTINTINSQDELGLLARDVNTLARTLKKHEENRQQWAADISHELRTPVNILKGEIEALQDGIRSTTPESLKSLHEETLRLEKLIGDLHQLSMSDLGALKYKFNSLAVDILLQDLLSDNDLLASKGIDATIKNDLVTKEDATIYGDEARLQQLFYNLLQNTARYTDDGGQLQVCITKTQSPTKDADPHLEKGIKASWLRIVWEDSSPGVADKDLPHLFERLFRVESSRNLATGGSGLGLSICQKIVEAHGGYMSATQSALGGLAISLCFPINQSK